MLKLYDFSDSGNGYKVRLLLALLDISCQYIETDITLGETRTPEFLEMNPNGKIPLLVLENGECLSESNAILHYLADGSDFLPTERMDHARMLQWMFFEQYSHEPAIAVARFIVRHLPEDHPRRGKELDSCRLSGREALRVMEGHLCDHEWFVAGKPTIADIALFAYTHVADEGGLLLDGYTGIGAWVDRVKSLPGFTPLR